MTSLLLPARLLQLASLFIALVIFSIWAKPAGAITIAPPSNEFTAKPGETITTKIKVINEEAREITLYPSAANFSAKDETGQPDFKFDAPTADLASWIVSDVTKLVLPPRGNTEVEMSITVPHNAEPGGHYAGFFFGTGSANGSQVSLQSKIGTLIIVRVEGRIRETASLKTFRLSAAQKTYTRPPVDFITRIANEGNVHIRPTGTVEITNMFGQTVASLPFNEPEGAVLPNSIRKFDTRWTKRDAGTDRQGFFSEVAAEWRNFGFGTYTATVSATYGQSSAPLTASTKFMILPWRLLLVMLALLGLLAFILIWGMKRYNAMIIRHAQQPPSSRDRRK